MACLPPTHSCLFDAKSSSHQQAKVSGTVTITTAERSNQKIQKMKICVCLCVYSLPSFVFDSEIHVSSINFINGKRFFCIYHIPNSFPKLKSVPVCLECCYLKYCILSKSFCLKYGITLTLIHISAILFQKLVIDLKKNCS